MFEVFDQPDTMVSCEQRNTTTVPTQALTLLNNEFSLLQSQYFAKRVREKAGDSAESQMVHLEQLIKTTYHIALSRDPRPAELADNLAFLEERRSHHASKPADDPALAALTDLCNVVLNLNEFLYVQ
jgi:hypothetical protein